MPRVRLARLPRELEPPLALLLDDRLGALRLQLQLGAQRELRLLQRAASPAAVRASAAESPPHGARANSAPSDRTSAAAAACSASVSRCSFAVSWSSRSVSRASARSSASCRRRRGARPSASCASRSRSASASRCSFRSSHPLVAARAGGADLLAGARRRAAADGGWVRALGVSSKCRCRRRPRCLTGGLERLPPAIFGQALAVNGRRADRAVKNDFALDPRTLDATMENSKFRELLSTPREEAGSSKPKADPAAAAAKRAKAKESYERRMEIKNSARRRSPRRTSTATARSSGGRRAAATTPPSAPRSTRASLRLVESVAPGSARSRPTRRSRCRARRRLRRAATTSRRRRTA